MSEVKRYDEAIRKRCGDEIGKLLAFIETTSGKRLSMSMIVNMQTGGQSNPVKRLEDWLYQFHRAAYADGQRDGMERAAKLCEAEALIDDERGYYGKEMAKAIRAKAIE